MRERLTTQPDKSSKLPSVDKGRSRPTAVNSSTGTGSNFNTTRNASPVPPPRTAPGVGLRSHSIDIGTNPLNTRVDLRNKLKQQQALQYENSNDLSVYENSFFREMPRDKMGQTQKIDQGNSISIAEKGAFDLLEKIKAGYKEEMKENKQGVQKIELKRFREELDVLGGYNSPERENRPSTSRLISRQTNDRPN